MSRYGVPQLRRIKIYYSDIDGSSRGVRAFLETKLPEFRSKNPHIIVETEIRRGPTRHPYIAAEYVSGKVENGKIRPKAVGLRNLEPKEIERHLNILRGSVGTGKRDFHQKQVTFHPSIQGIWHLKLNLEGLQLRDVNPQKQEEKTASAEAK